MGIGKLLISAGAMKAGTSYLYKMLERHPRIETTPVKEIHYFAHVHTTIRLLDDPARMHNLKNYVYFLEASSSVSDASRNLQFFDRYLRPTIDDVWYENLFLSGEDSYKADFSNMVSVLPEEGLRHMRTIAGELRVLYLMRDPLARLWSHVKFHAAVNNELGRLNAFRRDEFSAYFEATGAAAHGRYALNLTRMRSQIDTDCLKVIYFEDLIHAPQRELDLIFDFLGLAPLHFDDSDLWTVHNPGPEGRMPAAFLDAARALLVPEQIRLEEAGIGFHSRWQRLD